MYIPTCMGTHMCICHVKDRGQLQVLLLRYFPPCFFETKLSPWSGVGQLGEIS